MTLPDERYRSMKNAKEFLYSLLNTKKTPKVPKKIREQARNILKHYPWDLHIDMMAQKCPNIIKKG